MIRYLCAAFVCLLLFWSCVATENKSAPQTLQGTYRLLESTTIKGNDTLYQKQDTSKVEMIKMFNATRFSFFNHDRTQGKDSTALFVSGAGRYNLTGDVYVEHLDFCNFREWEGKTFHFTLKQQGDTLIQEGVEELPELGVKQFIIEKYLKID